MDISKDALKKSFETYCGTKHEDIALDTSGKYKSKTTQALWVLWVRFYGTNENVLFPQPAYVPQLTILRDLMRRLRGVRESKTVDALLTATRNLEDLFLRMDYLVSLVEDLADKNLYRSNAPFIYKRDPSNSSDTIIIAQEEAGEMLGELLGRFPGGIPELDLTLRAKPPISPLIAKRLRQENLDQETVETLHNMFPGLELIERIRSHIPWRKRQAIDDSIRVTFRQEYLVLIKDATGANVWTELRASDKGQINKIISHYLHGDGYLDSDQTYHLRNIVEALLISGEVSRNSYGSHPQMRIFLLQKMKNYHLRQERISVPDFNLVVEVGPDNRIFQVLQTCIEPDGTVRRSVIAANGITIPETIDIVNMEKACEVGEEVLKKLITALGIDVATQPGLQKALFILAKRPGLPDNFTVPNYRMENGCLTEY